MLDSICRIAMEAQYDFRGTAYPDDPMKERFPEWVSYYQTKWAIARVLEPKSILEIGVRFGYSAAAFLNGFPSAEYLGIDLDADSFGGTRGAIEWAKKITGLFRASFLIADSQRMDRFPGDVYDLIHVDGQQDGDGTFHDMQLAAKQGRYILADGYFWTRQNFSALTEFLYQFRDQIQYYGVIPGYAGELLIRMRDASPMRCEDGHEPQNTNSLTLRNMYTSQYYLEDCGGYVQYRENQGKRLEDARLMGVAAITGLKGEGRALDIGCGRGELAHYFAQEGFEVTAIDYSKDAIELTEKSFEGEPQLRRRVEVICSDVCTAKLSGKYDVMVAADLIEHLSPRELETLYARLADHLARKGVLIVHTFPNKWYYEYEYGRKRRIAASVGAYLSPQPRSRYEQLMHINEQSPRVLKKSLERHFSHVLLWFARPEEPAGSLTSRLSHRELGAMPDLFAVASHSSFKREQVIALLQTHPVENLKPRDLRFSVGPVSGKQQTGAYFQIRVSISNASGTLLGGFLPNPFRLSYHWMDATASNHVVYDGLRTNLFPALRPGRVREYIATVQAPERPGRYVLRMTLVQEFVRWFDNPPFSLWEDVSVEIAE